MNIARDEVMVIGDSFNDYSMFEEFKESYAMGNAIPEIKEIAKHITDTNDNAGVAKAIYKALNILIKNIKLVHIKDLRREMDSYM